MAAMTQWASDTEQFGDSRLARNSSNNQTNRSAFQRRGAQDYARSLSALIEGEIIPRLMAAHAVGGNDGWSARETHLINDSDIEALAPLVMQIDADALLAHVEHILERGVTAETVMVDLLAPTARLLGEFWEDDRCDFVDVTMGLWRLQEVVHHIASRAPSDGVSAGRRHRALFASMPGDQHSFGTVVIDEVFRRAGWLTDRIDSAEGADLLQSAADGWFDMIGLTISRDSHIGPLTSLIVALRNVSPNPQVCIMVGGRIFSRSPELAVQVGADGTAPDARLALEIAGTLVRQREWESAVSS
ncbi:cobalamin B12-binding domain-containing protein [Sphingomonas sp. PB2P19]|uniref:cobalamin B12-binding domain-containing protein n=1 Tax=Sphingomonas rhamnosi TaxID=3096156 RepID=UPI002FC83D61